MIRPQQVAQDTLWYKQAVIYNLEVGTFQDSDGDGRGDFSGLSSRLGYLDSLGINTIWLSPFFVSPGQDDGYDVADYMTVDPKLGTLADFRRFIAAAHERHIRVITDLAVNHTSDKHPWFRSARRSPASPYRNWYVWSKERPENWNQGMVFPGVQESIWSYDSVAAQYYYHRFYAFQPDLNMQNLQVQAAVRDIVRYWISLGLDGFRLDGVPFFIEAPQTSGDDFPRQYQMLTALRSYVDSLQPGTAILGEANVLPEETLHYFGRAGERMQLMFNFYVNQHLFLALATSDATPLRETLPKTANIPPASQWAYFLRNHDEVDLGRLTSRDRQRVYDAFGPEPGMQLYDRGIRRRLAPMLHNPAQLQMAYGLLLSLPGTPVLRYGDEIGMGDDLRLRERLPVRTPMQWDTGRNAGFTRADTAFRPLIDRGAFAFRQINVRAARADSGSLYHWIRKLISLRRSCAEIRSGRCVIPETGNRHVLGLHYQLRDSSLIVLCNLSPVPQAVTLSDSSPERQDLLRHGGVVRASSGVLRLTVPAYGNCWLRNLPVR